MIISSQLRLLSNPSIAFLDTLINITSIGNKIGKLNIAIKAPLLLALDAMEETIVRLDEKPIEPSRIFKKNKEVSCTGLPNMIE